MQIREFLQFDEENWKKIQNYVKNVDFWQNLPEICSWHVTSKMTNTQHIKISAEGERTATESFNLLEQIVFSTI